MSAADRADAAGDPARVREVIDTISVIWTKRDGGELSDAQIRWIVDRYARSGSGSGDVVAEEQMSALLMAILLRGMSRREIATWTQAMIDSGRRMDFSGLRRDGRPMVTVDKHSTGGVGDKITLPLAPLVASFGVAVPQLSGRGLGHTGGTLDKLESIPGWRAEVGSADMAAQLERVGAVVCAAGGDLAPADRRLYALRDVTGTVESIPLLASSIMSKKIAEGTGALVLDVKFGSGAFLKEEAQSRELAETMVWLGESAGVRTRALLTDMSTPLGLTAGNALEVAESLEVLAGGGPDDVVELTLALAREMLDAAGMPDADPAEHLAGGAAMDTWRAMIAAQGGDPDAPLPRARHTETIAATQGGVITEMDAMAVGVAAWRLGAGRAVPGQAVQAEAGITLHAKPGDRVRAGEPLFTLHTQTPDRFDAARAALDDAVSVGDDPPQRTPLVIDRVTVGS
ncbi:thymidine phosphorylase [Gordonia insulae]|uniref:Thymidine phosphorylase n=1 Tax=Gordonia insulae TaxID=2420509 RepID=A0A3G8JIX2_9ACTN|nr:thymidine phosphorylase [Gordonia insulae]AZG44888.1 Thymidine phosphorylase [Gordonia insulae]